MLIVVPNCTAALTGYSFQVSNVSGTVYSGADEAPVPTTEVTNLDVGSGNLSAGGTALATEGSLKSTSSIDLSVNQPGASDFTTEARVSANATSIFNQLGVVENAGENTSGFLQVGVQVDGYLGVSIDTTGFGFARIIDLIVVRHLYRTRPARKASFSTSLSVSQTLIRAIPMTLPLKTEY